jgi:hypothetical protein
MPPGASLTPPRWQIGLVVFLIGITLVWVIHTLFQAFVVQRDNLLAVTVSMGALLLVVLVVMGAVKTLSTKLTENGASQSRLFSNGRFISRMSLKWCEITEIKVEPGVIRLSGPAHGIEVHLGFFSEQSAVEELLRQKLPLQVRGNAL